MEFDKKLIDRNVRSDNSIGLTSELLLGLGVTSHSVTDPGISSTIGTSSINVLPKGSSIASCK